MEKIWILVADSANARILATTARTAMPTEVKRLEHPEGRLKESELVTDQPGRSRRRAAIHWRRVLALSPSDKKAAQALSLARFQGFAVRGIELQYVGARHQIQGQSYQGYPAAGKLCHQDPSLPKPQE